MKYMLLCMITLCAIAAYAFEVQPFGPGDLELTYANFQQVPFSVGGISNGQNGLFLMEGDIWNFYPWSSWGLPISSILNLNETTVMVAMGAGTYSDGVYNFDFNTHVWSINEWFMFPNFIRFNPDNDLYYVGERAGLFKSADADTWTRITALGTNECNSLAFYEAYLVTNNGQSVKYSIDNGQSWQTANTSNLRGFRFTSNGILYAIMDAGSDSDGLWRSNDYGATWNCVFFTSNLSCIGPDFGQYIVLGWSQPNEAENYLALVNQQYQLTQLEHDNLDSGVKQLEIFPLVDTPSFYVINSEGCYFLTGFLPVDNDDATAPVISGMQIQNYPNPFNQETSIVVMGVNKTNALRVEVYNLKGELVKSLYHGTPSPTNTFVWDGRDYLNQVVSSGFYIVRVKQNGRLDSRKILLLK